MKVWEAAPEPRRHVEAADIPTQIENVVLIEVEAFDWNFPQHFTPRFTGTQVAKRMAPLRARISELEGKVRERVPPSA